MTKTSVSPTSKPGKVTPADTRKPYEGFPLTFHPTGRFCKKSKGVTFYYGRVADGWEKAVAAFERYWPFDSTGRARPADVDPNALTISRLCDHFYAAKQQRHEAGEITARTLAEYDATCKMLTDAMGENRPVTDLAAIDFAKVREQLAARVGPVRLVNEITRVRGVFKFGFDNGLIDRPVRFGSEFNRPSKKTLRLARAEKGSKLLSAAEVRQLIDDAGVPMEAMILLAINCGLGNSDVSALNQSHVDLEARVIDFPRPKTGIVRRGILWPETVKAIRAAIAARPDPIDAKDAAAVFITRWGTRWTKGKSNDAVGLQFGKLLKALKIERAGVNFYALRHTFRTVADAAGDQRAVDRVMGHESGHISTSYVEAIDDARLKKVSAHVRKWLYTKAKK